MITYVCTQNLLVTVEWMISMNVQDLTILICNYNVKRKSFEKVKMCGTSFIRWIKNGNTYFEYDKHPNEVECELKKFMKEQEKYLDWLLIKELSYRQQHK